eukprot:1516958-Amphidinium_carterae.1
MGKMTRLQSIGRLPIRTSFGVVEIAGILNIHDSLWGLKRNYFTGSIPGEFGRLHLLQTVMIQENKFSGSLPEELVELRHLRLALVSRNRLAGELFNMPFVPLIILDFSSNAFSGAIPHRLVGRPKREG